MGLIGAGNLYSKDRPWKEAGYVVVEGTVEEKSIKDNKQIIILKNISVLSKPENSKANIKIYQNSKLIAYMNQNTKLKIGNKVRITGKISYPSKPANPGGFDGESYYLARHITIILYKADVDKKSEKYSYIKEACFCVKETCKNLIETICSRQEAGVVEALLLGSRENLDDETKSLYQDNGLIHVLSISGLHISAIGMVVFHFLRKRGKSFLLSALSAMLILLLYGILTSFPISAVRAILMFGFYLGAQVSGRTYDMPIAVTVTAACILCANPSWITQSSFLLSFSAVLGVYGAAFWKSKWLKGTALGVGLMVWLVTLPITAYFFYQVPVYGIVLNLLIVPSMSAIMGLGILGIIGSVISIEAGKFIYGGIHYILQCTFFLEERCRNLPGAVWITGRPGRIQMVIFYVILLYFVCFFRKTNKIDLIKMTFGIILGIGVLFYHGSPGWSVTFLNVGQGDGICIRTTHQTAWLVDGGSSSEKDVSERILEPYLKYYGVSQIDGWIVSHFDYDHISGLLEFLEGYEKDISGNAAAGITLHKIFIPDLEGEDELQNRLLTLAAEKGIPVVKCKKGDKIIQDRMKMEILNPDKQMSYADGNAASMVMKVNYGDFSVLLTGDVQENGESGLEEEALRDVDVIKISHHGSKNSTLDAFLEKTNAKQAVISCGENNFYGHPHQELLTRLQKAGFVIYRTDRDGAITFTV